MDGLEGMVSKPINLATILRDLVLVAMGADVVAVAVAVLEICAFSSCFITHSSSTPLSDLNEDPILFSSAIY